MSSQISNFRDIGLLGNGFLGDFIVKHPGFSNNSWHTNRNPSIQKNNFVFDLSLPSSYKNLPDKESILIFSIPPISKEIKKNALQIRNWCFWIQKYRPLFKRLIYISSLSVYPMIVDDVTEDFSVPDTNKGRLRLQTEKILAEFFDLKILRPGGIYGPNRNLLKRLRENKSSTHDLTRPIFRIHAQDLANLILHLIRYWEKMPVVCNAVDEYPENHENIVKWAQTNHLLTKDPNFIFSRKVHLDSSIQKRQEYIMKNNTGICPGFKLLYPSYREGFLECLNYETQTTN